MYKKATNIRKYSTTPIVKVVNDQEQMALLCPLPKKDGEIFTDKIIKMLNQEYPDAQIGLYEEFINRFADKDYNLKPCNPFIIFDWFMRKIYCSS
jgi:hypothetical protein